MRSYFWCPIPEGADAVVIQATSRMVIVIIHESAIKGANIRSAGIDFHFGKICGEPAKF